MKYADTIQGFAQTARSKADMIRENPLGFLVLAMKAGAYVGLGIILIFSAGQGLDPSLRPIVMGASFGIALTLVVFAGSELYTGHTMYMTVGWLTGRTGPTDLLKCWAGSWFGNLAGAGLLACIFVIAGGGVVLKGEGDILLHAVAAKKINAPAVELFARAVLCNWLVCLALWCSARSLSDTAKCILIFWCLYAFIAAGFEHSVANMTVFGIALLSEHPDAIGWAGAARNLLIVTAGNAVAGVFIMGVGYWLAAGRPRVSTPAPANLPMVEKAGSSVTG